MLCLGLTAILSSNLRAQRADADELKAEILLKLLSRNRALDVARLDTIRLALVYDSTDAAASREAGKFYGILLHLPTLPFKKTPLVVQMTPVQALYRVDWEQLQAVLLIPGRRDITRQILPRCREWKVLSMSTDPTLIARGVSVAVETRGKSQPEIWMNVNALKSEGASYDPEILELVKHLIWQ
ncbi:MAG: hypothetical protein D6681_00050 [Calditrichaeota bacterium]|nr:MAG: hypothetical protein D6681_00050 [Calditrichota bacterium]